MAYAREKDVGQGFSLIKDLWSWGIGTTWSVQSVWNGKDWEGICFIGGRGIRWIVIRCMKKRPRYINLDFISVKIVKKYLTWVVIS